MAPSPRDPVAIIGIGCRFPRAAGPAEFWRLLTTGTDAVGEIPADRFDVDALYDPAPATPGKMMTRWGGFVDADRFDAEFFGMSPREAERLDPQQRLLLETAWEALEDAGLQADRLAGTQTGVYVGMWINEYEARLFRDPRQLDFYMTTGSGRYSASGRLSYTFGFQGPSLTVDTGCSASLVALHLACQSLRSGETTLALAAGSNAILEPNITIAYSQSRMMAPDGRCKFGDARADGYVRSEGTGVVVLKRLSRALADGDRIYATIEGSAVNNDGRSSGFLTTPGPAGQEEMLRLAYRNAGIVPGRVTYVEAHGTGTRAGDPVEIQALGAVLGEGRAEGRPCRLGSVKTNIGHTEGAAGMAGVIKVALSLANRTLVPSLHFETPNPAIPWDTLPLTVQRTLEPWPAGDGPAVAGVSSFGIAGTNAHVVLQEPPAAPTAVAPAGSPVARPFVLSAHSAEALAARAAQIRDRLREAVAPASLDALCWTAAARRSHLEHRLAVLASSIDELAAGLDAAARREPAPAVVTGRAHADRRSRVAFVFPGQGSQWIGMGRQLLDREPAFRAALEACDRAILAETGWSVVEQLRHDAEQSRMREIDVIQPVLFSVEVALAALWRSWGFEPAAVVGHSMGEVAASHVAGALSLDDAVAVICRRSRLLRRTSGQGAMAVVELTMGEAAAALAGREQLLSVAVSNSTRSTVISGDPAALDALIGELEAREVFCRRVKVDVASHSPQMDPLRADLLSALADVRPAAAAVPIYSTVDDRATDGAGFDAAYWVRNLRAPVLFGAAVQRLLADGHDTFIEMSPHPILVPAVQEGLRESGVPGTAAVGSTRRDEDESYALAGAVASLHAAGHPIAWDRLLAGPHAPIDLPLYPWQRERFWFDAPSQLDLVTRGARADGRSASHPVLGARTDVAGHAETWSWEFDLSRHDCRYFSDVRVKGETILPMSAYLELALAAARDAFGDGARALVDVEIVRPLVLPGEAASRRVQVVMAADGPGSAAFGVYARSGDRWDLHARGATLPAAGDVLAVPEPAAACDAPAVEAYRALEEAGVEPGPSLRALDVVGVDGAAGCARVAVGADQQRDLARFAFHPGVLEAGLQLAGAAAVREDGARACVPVRVARAEFVRAPGAVMHARSTRSALDAGRDVTMSDPSGAVAVRLTGVVTAPADQVLAGSQPEAWLHQLEWEEASAPAAPAAAPPSGAASAWLVVADRGDVGARLAEALAARGVGSVLVEPGERFAELGPGRYSIGDGVRRDLEQVYDHAFGPGRRCERVVYLRALDEGARATGSDPWRSATGLVETAVEVVQTLAGRAGAARIPIWLATAGAQPVADADDPIAVAQAPLWGVGRAVAEEHPDLWGGLVDLDPAAAPDRCAADLIEAVTAGDREDQVAYRGGRRHALRLAPWRRPDGERRPLRLRRDSSYLIAGGLGELGLAAAEWLVARGARRIVLLGRTALPPRAEWDAAAPGTRTAARIAAVRRLEALGASVHLATVDLANRGAVEQFLREFSLDGWPPIRGVLQCAGVIEAGLLQSLDRAAIDSVLRSKLAGTWHLHTSTQAMPLDFFVMFSSIASFMFLSPGTATYAVANLFLDAMAYHRRRQGLPATSINWGPWTIGMAVAPGDGDVSLADRGVFSLTPERAMGALASLVEAGAIQAAVMPFDARRWRPATSREGAPKLFARLLSDARPLRQAETGPDDDLRSRLLQASPGEEREQTLQVFLQDQVAGVLRRPASRIDVLKPLRAMGLDSLMALELRNRLEASLDLRLPATLAFNYPTIARMASHLLDKLALPDSASAEGAAAPSLDDLERLLAEVEQLPDEEAARLLSGPLADV